jgi:hypothetical protein
VKGIDVDAAMLEIAARRERADGCVLPSATIRRFKLNLLGKRLAQTSEDDTEDAGVSG